MSNRNLQYINNYVGPVFLLKKKKITFAARDFKRDTCSNPSCSNHGDDTLQLGFYNYCPKCGSKVKYCSIEKKVEVYPSISDDWFANNMITVANDYFNGISMYLVEPLLSADEFLYLPFVENKSDFAIYSSVSLGKYCKNKKCNVYDECTNGSYDYCVECGNKLKLDWDSDTHSIFDNKTTKEILKSYVNKTNTDYFVLFENHIFDDIVKKYKETEDYHRIVKILEDLYGENSVTLLTAFVQYHDNY